MKKVSIALCLVLFMASGVFGADKVTVKKGRAKMSYAGTFVDYRDFKVSFKAGVSQKTYSIFDILSIEYGKNQSFTGAEKLLLADKKDYKKILSLYSDAEALITKRWEKELIYHRKYMVLDDAGQLDKAVIEWLKMMDRSGAAKAVIAFMPNDIEASTPGTRRVAIRKLDAKAQSLERDRSKYKTYLGAVYSLTMVVQNSVGDSDGANKTKAKIDGLGAAAVAPPKNGGGGSTSSNGGGGTRIRTGNLGALEKMVPRNPGSVVAQIQGGLVVYERQGMLGKAARVMGLAQMHMYKKGGSKDKELLKEAGLNFMLAFYKDKGSAESLDALWLASVVNKELGQNAAEKAALKLLVKFDWVKGDPSVKKAKERLGQL